MASDDETTGDSERPAPEGGAAEVGEAAPEPDVVAKTETERAEADEAELESSSDRPSPVVARRPAAEDPYRARPGPAHEDHGLAHITPVGLLVAILAILLVLTVATVLVTGVDLGGQWNLVVAMVIATIKAGLVVAYFMHLRWDRSFHFLVFMSSVLFLILFLALSLTDRREYQQDIDLHEQQQAQTGG
jgi:cytochrome c oxidase subunit IV